MPRKLSEIKQFVSKNSLNHILQDPAQNSVMGNIKKLHDALAEVPDDTIADGARKKLGTILDGFNGTYPETLRIFRSGFLPQTCLGSIRQHAGTVCILIEYMAGGLGLAPDGVPLSEEQKKNIANMEASGVAAVAAEQKADRKKALEAKSGLEVLDEHKAAIGALPKKCMGPHAEIEEAAASQQLRGLCLDILATRCSIEAQRMVLLQKKAAFQQDKNSDKLGTKGLMAQAQGDGAKLVESYALAKQDKLEYYNPVAPAPAKNGPQNEAENKGPQINM